MVLCSPRSFRCPAPCVDKDRPHEARHPRSRRRDQPRLRRVHQVAGGVAAHPRQPRGHRAPQPRGLSRGGGELSIRPCARLLRRGLAAAYPRQAASLFVRARWCGRCGLFLSARPRRSLSVSQAQTRSLARHRRAPANRSHRRAGDRRRVARRTGGACGGRTARPRAHGQGRRDRGAWRGARGRRDLRRSRRRGRRLAGRTTHHAGRLMHVPHRADEGAAPPRGSAWRSALFILGMAISTLIFAPLSELTFPFPYRWRYAIITQWTRFTLWRLALTCRLRYVVEGREHMPAGPAIVLAKHQSAFETLAFQRSFPPQVCLLKRELLWVPFFGWGLAMLEPIAIDRKATRKALQQLLTIGGARLEHGRWVVIFPEGTRTAPGKKGRYAPGGAMLAARSGYPVVPVAHNAGEFWPRRGFIKRPGTIRIVIGPVIDSRGRSAQEINALAEEWIESEMQRLAAAVTGNSSSS